MALRTSEGTHQKPTAAYRPMASAAAPGIQMRLRLIQAGMVSPPIGQAAIMVGARRDGKTVHGLVWLGQ